MGVPVPSYGDAELKLLRCHDWPGNVRELRNVIVRSMLLGCPSSWCVPVPRADSPILPQHESADLRLQTMEQRHIHFALQSSEGNGSEASRRLRISRKTPERKLKSWAGQGIASGAHR